MIPICLLFVMTLSQTVFNSADITMLGLMKGDYAVGIYSTAAKIEKVISQIVSSVVYVLIPRLSYMFDSGEYEKINKLLRNVLGVFATIGLPSCAGAAVMAKEIILIVGGVKYVEATLVLQILLLSFLFSLVGGSFLGNVVLLPSGNEKQFMIICCISTVVNVIANAFLIPRWGAYAAAGTTAFSSLLIMLMLIASVDKQIKIQSPVRLFLAPLGGSVIMSICCVWLKQFFEVLWIRTIVCVISGVVVYGIVQILLKNEMVLEIFEKRVKVRKDK